MFGLIVPDKTTKKTSDSKNLKLLMQYNLVFGFGIIRLHNQNAFCEFGVTTNDPGQIVLEN